jgi:hypothetical protein
VTSRLAILDKEDSQGITAEQVMLLLLLLLPPPPPPLLLLLPLLYRAQLTPETVGAVQQPRRLPPCAAGPAPQNYNHKPLLKNHPGSTSSSRRVVLLSARRLYQALPQPRIPTNLNLKPLWFVYLS